VRHRLLTEILAGVSACVHATDLNAETLALARARPYPRGNVTLEARDAYARHAGPPRWDAGFAGLWLSHVDLTRMAEFLDAFHSHLLPGALVMAFDESDDPTRRFARQPRRRDGQPLRGPPARQRRAVRDREELRRRAAAAHGAGRPRAATRVRGPGPILGRDLGG